MPDVTTVRSVVEQKVNAARERLSRGGACLTELGLLLGQLERIGVAEDALGQLGVQVTGWVDGYVRNGHAGMAG